MLEVYLLRSLLTKKINVKLRSRKLCCVEVKANGIMNYGNFCFEALPDFQASKSRHRHAGIQDDISEPCFQATKILEPSIFAWNHHDLLLDLAYSSVPSGETSLGERSLHWVGFAEPVLNFCERKILFELSSKCDSTDSRGHNFVEFIFKNESAARVLIRNRQHITLSTNLVQLLFVSDQSMMRRIRYIPITSQDPIHIFWCVFLYHEHLRKYDPQIHRLESMVASLWSIFQTDLEARVSLIKWLTQLQNMDTDRRYEGSKDFSLWVTQILEIFQTCLLTWVHRALIAASAIPHLDSQTARGIQSLRTQLNKQTNSYSKPHDCLPIDSWKYLKHVAGDLLSQKVRWLLLCAVQTVNALNPALLDEAWVAMHDMCPHEIQCAMEQLIVRLQLSNFEVCKVLKPLRGLLVGETFSAQSVTSYLFGAKLLQTLPSVPRVSVVFDIGGKVHARRFARSKMSIPQERFLIWKGNLVLLTRTRVLVCPPACPTTPWNSRTASKPRKTCLRRQCTTTYCNELDLLFDDRECLTFRVTGDDGEDCFLRRGYWPLQSLFLFHSLHLNISPNRTKVDCRRFYQSNKRYYPILDRDGVVHSVHTGASAGFVSVHFMTYMNSESDSNYNGEFLIVYKPNTLYPRTHLAELENPLLQRRLACPVPTNLMVPKSKRHRLNFNGWVKLFMFCTDPKIPEKFELFAHFQTVEISGPDPDEPCRLITKANLIKCVTQYDYPVDRLWSLEFKVHFEQVISVVHIPALRNLEDCLTFDPEQSEWAHHFLWKKLSIGVTGIRVEPNGDYMVFSMKNGKFQVVRRSHLSLSPGKYYSVKPAMCEASTGTYFCKIRTAAEDLQRLTLYELTMTV